MQRKSYIIVAGLAVVAAVACTDVATTPPRAAAPSFSNGFPDNGHATLYKMNLIGVPKGKTASMTGDEGKRIFVNLDGKTRIYLTEGETFDILDANGTDANGATFQLPNPDPITTDNVIETWYSVWVRAKGKPNTSMQLQTCAYDVVASDTTMWCSTEDTLVVRSKGRPTAMDVSRILLTVCVDTDLDGTCDKRVALFDDDYMYYLWELDNNGLRNAEVRFLEIATGPYPNGPMP